MTKEIRAALARGYCTKRNSKKVLDSDLIDDMAREIEKLSISAIEQRERLREALKLSLKIAEAGNPFDGESTDILRQALAETEGKEKL